MTNSGTNTVTVLKEYFFFFSGTTFSIIYYSGVNGCGLYFVLTITEIVFMKVLYIFKFSAISAVNEYFVKNLLISFNFVCIGNSNF